MKIYLSILLFISWLLNLFWYSMYLGTLNYMKKYDWLRLTELSWRFYYLFCFFSYICFILASITFLFSNFRKAWIYPSYFFLFYSELFSSNRFFNSICLLFLPSLIFYFSHSFIFWTNSRLNSSADFFLWKFSSSSITFFLGFRI